MKNLLVTFMVSFMLVLLLGFWYVDILPFYWEAMEILDFNSFHNVAMTFEEVEEINNISYKVDVLFLFIIISVVVFLFSLFNLIWLFFIKIRGDFGKTTKKIEC